MPQTVKILGDVAKTASFPDWMSPAQIQKALDDVKDLLFLHNTSAEKLARSKEMGGMPMPSIAVTQKDIPFEGFGDITLVGKPDAFDPSIRANKLYSADAYTVRAPSPVQKAKKKAYERFREEYAPYRDAGYYDDTLYALGELETKRGVSESEYGQVQRFFEGNGMAVAKFLDEKGVPLPKKPDGSVDGYALHDMRLQNKAEYDQWAAQEMDKFFEPEKYFIANPDRDRYTTNPRLKPYTADEVTSFMKKRSGRGQENTMTTGAGQIRASTTEQFKSLAQAKKNKGMLKSAEDVAEMKQTSDMMLDDLGEALKKHYEFSADGWRYRDEVGEMLASSERKGLRSALTEFGFKDVPEELVKEISEYKDFLRTAPTEYFESKPERVVGLEDFAGAIVPKGTDEKTLKALQDAGLKVKTYATDKGRQSARRSFRDQMFLNPITSLGALDLARQDRDVEVDAQLAEVGIDPYENPNFEYGTILPYRKSKIDDRIEPAVPSFLRDAIRGVTELGVSATKPVITPSSFWETML